ncbi:ABC transporter ATP-binding protein [Parendozoicomonas haliclonae]|uniref:Spermidine/putrescine import ATP-binding protein PotA n=1 Tax=Parendozoicomonas haliclonae TaxID=1960125 RepID=A0A1X7AGC4_9GAMM|nr:ABC transporter ATP-binding protein [Parendozoicomonas haliclonae]SMA39661.1 Spermidine/putrescine import ATP-binding protein PotA [Parendozoicomonas haliclonae]
MSSSLSVSAVTAGYDAAPILKDISFDIQRGEFVALLGPSGCGKTTLLQVLSGFLPVQSGQIFVGDQEITRQPPERRDMAMVFQSYALWPHMTVFQNIAYALKLRRMDKTAIAQRVQEMLELVNLEGYEHRPVTALSGGQRQRVALARALAVQPSILLLDEPLSNLDARVRAVVRHEIKSLQKKLGFTAVMVTHDQEEAMSMADRIIILNQGRIEQAGSPQELYRNPQTSFVADFMGADNRLSGLVRQSYDGLHLYLGEHCEPVVLNSPLDEGAVDVRFRSEEIQLSTDASASGLRGEVLQNAYLGQSYRHTVQLGETTCLIDHPEPLAEGTHVSVTLPADVLHIFPARKQAA